MLSMRYSCPVLMKLEFCRQFRQILTTNFTKFRKEGAELFGADGRPDRHMDEADSRSLHFWVRMCLKSVLLI
jgi:hypothetical protein